MSKLIESMYYVKAYGYDIRVWRQETELKDYYDNEDILFNLFKLERITSLAKIAKYISDCPRVNAVEVKINGQGIVIYNDWP